MVDQIICLMLKFMLFSFPYQQGLFPTVHGIFADFMERDGMVGAFDPRSNPQSIALQDPGWYNGKSVRAIILSYSLP